MAKIVTPLTDSKIRNSKAKEKEYNLSDGNGLSLRVKPNGTKSWLFNYTKPKLNKRTNIKLGSYPDMPLAKAREKRLHYRELLAEGIDPREHLSAEKEKYSEKNSFKHWATDYLTTKTELTQKTQDGIQSRLNNHIYPKFAHSNITEITPKSILEFLKEIEVKGHYETAKRCKSIMSQVFRHAIIHEACTNDPCHAIGGALTKSKPKNMPTLTSPSEIGQLMRDIDSYQGTFVVKQALKLAPHLMLRPNEIRFTQWDYIDFDLRQWKIPAEKMKMRKVHVVPLSSQVLALLQELHNVTGDLPFLFPHVSKSSRTMSENSINQALHTLGYKDRIVAHGFRSMASTLLHENGFDTLVIEKQLAHQDTNSIRASYNHADFWEQRLDMMQFWSDYLDKVREQS